MPFNNEYNRSISRDIDYFNKRYIAHCDSTGTGTQNYRVQMSSGLSGGGAGSKEFHCGSDSSDSEQEGGYCGGAILGFQAGTILGGPKTASIPTRREISSKSSLGAPISKNPLEEASRNNMPTVPPEAAPPPPEAGAPPKAGGAILGLTPPSFPAPPLSYKRKSTLTVALAPPSGRMFRAGKFVSVRDLGDEDSQYNHLYKNSRYEPDSESDTSSEEEDSESEKEGGYCGDNPAPRAIGTGKPKKSGHLDKIADVGLKAMDKYDEMDDEDDVDSEDEDSENEDSSKRARKAKKGGYLDIARKCHETLESHRKHHKSNGTLEGSGFLSVAARGARLAARFGMKAAKAAAKMAAKGAKAAAKATARGAKTAAKAAAKTAKQAAKGVAKGAKAAARLAKRGAKAVKQAAKNVSKQSKGRFGDMAKQIGESGISQLVSEASRGDIEGQYDYEPPEEEEEDYDEEDEEEEDDEEGDEEEPDYEEQERKADEKEAAEEEEEEEEDDEEEDDDDEEEEDEDEGMDQEDMMKKLESKMSPGADAKGPKWLKDTKEVQQVQKEKVKEIDGYDIFSQTPEADFVRLYGNQYGEMGGKSIAEIIDILENDGLTREDVQKLLSQSQGALKTMAAKDVSETLKTKYEAREDFGNKNKNTSCMDAFNNVASKSETVQKETKPIRRNDTYFGTGSGLPKAPNNMKKIEEGIKQRGKEKQAVQEGLKFGKIITKNKQALIDQIRKEKGLPPQLPSLTGGFFKETMKATRGEQTEMKTKAQMNSSTMSGMGKPKKEKKPKKELKAEAQMKGSTMSGMGKVKKPNKRAEIVRQVMKEKGMKMIEASKYVKANNLYKP